MISAAIYITCLLYTSGFHTTWLSAQTAFGNYGSSVAGIAMNAKDKLYIKGYDKELIPHLKTALAKPGHDKKLIILHLYGSHEPACARYPSNEAIFDKNCDIDACYDNSVLYTDSLFGEIFSLLKQKNASVFYFSDHALERDPKQSAPYFHGGITPSQEAYHVPMFIWYLSLIHIYGVYGKEKQGATLSYLTSGLKYSAWSLSAAANWQSAAGNAHLTGPFALE